MPQIIMAVVALLVFAGGYYFFSAKEEVPVVTPPALTETAPIAPPVTTKKKYFDGQYSAEGSYTIPTGELEKMTVSLTLKDGIITEADFTSNPIEAGSKFNQGKFREGFRTLVVGKDIDTVTLTVVNGASLTGMGFNEALKAIKEKAQTQATVPA